MVGARNKARVGLIFDWHNWWAVELCSGPSKDLQYLPQVQKYYKAFYERNIPIDVLRYDQDLSSYDLIITPCLYQMRGDLSERIRAYVQKGGPRLTSVFSGIAKENDQVILGGYPGGLREVLGIWIEETDALPPHMNNRMHILPSTKFSQDSYACSMLYDLIHLEGAEALAVYEKEFYADMPGATVHTYGKGKAYYVGTDPEQAFIDELSGQLCQDLGLQAPLKSPMA